MIEWQLLHPEMTHAHLGFIPSWISESSPEPAAAQIHRNYGHGGGWQSFKGFRLNRDTLEISYPGDPPMAPLARATLRDETILFYPYSWVGIIQKDGSFDIARID